MRSVCLYVPVAALLVACGLNDADEARVAEEKRIQCLDQLCEGDIVPAYDAAKEFALKLNGRWFVGPRQYGGYGGSFSFLWPSKTPANIAGAAKSAPEFVPSSAGVTSNFYDVAVEVFLRSNNSPPRTPSAYQALQNAQRQGRVVEMLQARPGLEVWRVQDENKGLPPSLWYVATNLRDANAEPPVLHCDDQTPKFDRCTMAFFWQPGIAADLRFRAKHAQDWPEIYQEVNRVLGFIRRA